MVQQPEATPRGHLTIQSARYEDSRSTLILKTDPHPLSVPYVLCVSGNQATDDNVPLGGFEVEYDFHGVATTYSGPEPASLRSTTNREWTGSLAYPTWSIGTPFLKPWIDNLFEGRMPRQ